MAKKDSSSSKKAEAKAKAKIIEDKTFGLKNKNKSTKVSKFVKQLEEQVKFKGNRKEAKEEQAKKDLQKRKKEELLKKEQEEKLMAPAIITQPKVPFGEDPKSFLCRLFKAGQCKKGDKCKYSHDMDVERKKSKIDLYTDRTRPAKDMDIPMEGDTPKGSRPGTTIVCTYFIEAIEKKQYGWLWKCPNGEKCLYRHALPHDYVFKNAEIEKNAADEISIEEFIENEKLNLPEVLTPVTEETFKKWKEARIAKSIEDDAKKKKQKLDDIKQGKATASGREIFTSNPTIAHDNDDDEAMDEMYLNMREDNTQCDDEYEEDQAQDENDSDRDQCLANALEDLDI